MIIDAHCHAFLPQDIETLAQRMELMDEPLDPEDPNKWRLLLPGDLESLVLAQSEAGVERFILLPVSGSKNRVSQMNQFSAAAAKEHESIIGFGTLHPKGDAAGDLEELLSLGLKGVKLHPMVQRFDVDHPGTHELLALLEPCGLPILMDTLYLDGLLKAKPHLGWVMESFGLNGCTPRQIARAAKAFPRLNIIAAHGGSLYGWDHLAPLWELDNVYFDISAISGLLAPEEVVGIIRKKGPDHIIYGSDAPWRLPSEYRAWFESLPLSGMERERIAFGTINSLLG